MTRPPRRSRRGLVPVLKYVPPDGESLNMTGINMALLADERGEHVVCLFNGMPIKAKPEAPRRHSGHALRSLEIERFFRARAKSIGRSVETEGEFDRVVERYVGSQLIAA